ncbi:hypothetical protein HALDL1_10030 [Halobacterium sp. DL1]|jgi:rubrerythrin|nr:hypothetical protein HALDL1_10030 [Halobacterium sp. DL1]
MEDSGDDSPEAVSIESGDTVYDDEGHVLGMVTESTDEGFAVEVVEAGPDVEVSEEGTEAADDDGEGYLMWRCEDCGEMGDLDDGIPEECPNCGAPKEHIHKAQED